MNDLEKNRIQRIENQMNALTPQIVETNRDLLKLYEMLGDAYDPDSKDAQKIARLSIRIQRRIEALRTITPRDW